MTLPSHIACIRFTSFSEFVSNALKYFFPHIMFSVQLFLWPLRMYIISFKYFINGAIFGKKIFCIKYLFLIFNIDYFYTYIAIKQTHIDKICCIIYWCSPTCFYRFCGPHQDMPHKTPIKHTNWPNCVRNTTDMLKWMSQAVPTVSTHCNSTCFMHLLCFIGILVKQILMRVAKPIETCRWTSVYDTAYFVSVNLLVCYVNVKLVNARI